MIEVPPSDDTSLDARLAELLAMDPDAPEKWTEEDLAAMWQHLLRTPLSVELGRISTAMEAIRRWEMVTGLHEATFADLLHHENPPVELLKAVKQFGKSVCGWQRGFPAEIAQAAYLIAIKVADVRCGERISMLERESLSDGLMWLSSQRWVDEQSRRIARDKRR